MNFAQQRNPTRQFTGFAIVMVVHALLVYALVTGLAQSAIEVLKGPLEAKIIQEVKPPPPDAPPPPPPELAPPPPPFIPPPEVNIQAPVTPTNAIQAVTSVVPVAPPAPPAPKPAVVDTAVSARAIDNSLPVYPKRMQDSGREGSVDVECTIDTDGSTSNCTLIEVKGGDAFGESAITWVKTHKYRPATHNGAPVKEEHHRFHIPFTLH